MELSFGTLAIRATCISGEVDAFGLTTRDALRATLADLQAAPSFADLPFGADVVDVRLGSVTVDLDPQSEFRGALVLRPGQSAPADAAGWGISRRIRIDEIRAKEDR